MVGDLGGLRQQVSGTITRPALQCEVSILQYLFEPGKRYPCGRLQSWHQRRPFVVTVRDLFPYRSPPVSCRK